MNPYLQILEQNRSRLLNLYNTDLNAKTYGFGDRIYWGWKTIDFPNASMQGGVHTLAIAYKLKLLDQNWTLELIDAIIKATSKIIRKNGSAEEAYPNENSFCVSALVAFDLLSAIDMLSDEITEDSKAEYFKIITPLIKFISAHGEEHAIISNHLATGVAAIVLWNKLTGDKSERHKELLEIIYQNQSTEGWYLEYEGADPGYQTLCTYYLASAYLNDHNVELKKSLEMSASFLRNFVHPDGTIGGLYGSRNTEVYYPGGIVALSHIIDDFAFIANRMSEGIEKGNQLLPQAIDANNYIPLLNSYAFAGFHYCGKQNSVNTKSAFFESDNEKLYPQAGILLKSNLSYFCILNYKKGGTIKIFDLRSQKLDIEDGGLFGQLVNGVKFSTQQYDNSTQLYNYSFKSYFYKINESYPGLWQTIILRMLSLTIFRVVFFGNIFKKLIVKMLMTGKNRLKGSVQTELSFEDAEIVIKHKVVKSKIVASVGHIGKAKAMHMASSGYFMEPHLNLFVKSKILKCEVD